MISERQSVFIDTSILVEFKKQSKTDLLLHFLKNPNLELVINSIVLSEYTFYLLAIEGEKAPRTIKERGEIQTILERDQLENFLSILRVLESGNEIVRIYLKMMEKYNLLPNDALILTCCKLHGISALASYDVKDFEEACSLEKIRLIRTIADFS